VTMRFTVLYNSTFWGMVNLSFGGGLALAAHQAFTVSRWEAYTPWNIFAAVVLALFATFFIWRGAADILS